MKETEFLKLARQEILYIQDKLENSSREDLDIDLLDDILYVKFEDSSTYVINKHSSMKEIWLSSPISGAFHFTFDYKAQRWIDGNRNEIRELLGRELGVKI